MLKNIRAKVFPAPGFKNVLSCYSYSTGFLKKKLIVNAKKRTIMTMPFVYIKLEKLEGSAEPPGRAAETV